MNFIALDSKPKTERVIFNKLYLIKKKSSVLILIPGIFIRFSSISLMPSLFSLFLRVIIIYLIDKVSAAPFSLGFL